MFSMSKSIFSRMFRKKSRQQGAVEEVSVDISRVIPGFKHKDRDAAAPETVDASIEDADMMVVEEAAEMAFLHPEDKAEAAVDALGAKHDTWARNDLQNLSQAWAEARKHSDMSDHLIEVTRVAHNLKGMATTYGHPAISRLATSLTQLLGSAHAGTQHALINLHVEACKAAYIEGTNSEHSDQIAQSVCVALETQVKRTLEA